MNLKLYRLVDIIHLEKFMSQILDLGIVLNFIVNDGNFLLDSFILNCLHLIKQTLGPVSER